jgi:hypothetical protein
MKVAVEITGADDYRQRMKGLPQKLVKSILGKAVNAAATPVLKAARNIVPYRTGALRRMLIKKVKRREDTVTAIIGPKNEYEGKFKPSRYAHLLEWGRRWHKRGGAMAGRYWLTQATTSSTSQAQTLLEEKIASEIDKL